MLGGQFRVLLGCLREGRIRGSKRGRNYGDFEGNIMEIGSGVRALRIFEVGKGSDFFLKLHCCVVECKESRSVVCVM